MIERERGGEGERKGGREREKGLLSSRTSREPCGHGAEFSCFCSVVGLKCERALDDRTNNARMI